VSSREEVLRRVRDAIGPSPVVPEIPRDYRRRGTLDPAAVRERFAERVDDYRATVHRCGPDQVAEVVAAALAAGAADRVVLPPQPPPGLPDGWRPGDAEVVVDDGGLGPADLDAVDAVVTGCAVAIAETGTIVLDASPDQGRRALTLVPDHHVCVVEADRIVETVPEALERLEATRPLTMISGPSATSDIELDRVEGVHGPRRLDVVVVDPA
jgi:L-lactate dehydrogenase complex protein LldG